MTIAPETLMAYADGELDPLAAKRVERAMADDPALAAEVAAHRRLRARIADGFAAIADEPVPDRLAALLTGNVVQIDPRPRAPWLTPWRAGAAMAASLALGLALGPLLDRAPVVSRDGRLYAAGALSRALEEQVGGAGGEVRIAASFRARDGGYCRVFAATVADGIACRDADGWALRRTQPGTPPRAQGGYAQAGSTQGELMAAAQDMMAGDPLDATGEATARRKGWR